MSFARQLSVHGNERDVGETRVEKRASASSTSSSYSSCLFDEEQQISVPWTQ